MRTIFIILLFSVLIHLPVVLNNGVFWDDWTLFNMSSEGLEEEFRSAGGYYMGAYFLHYFLQQAPEPALVYRVLTFILSFFSVLLFYKLLLRFKEVPHNQAFYMAIVFIVLPFFSAKTTMICLPYTICLTLFLAGFYLYTNILEQPSLWKRLLSLICFFVSFITNSLLFFYLIIPLYIPYVKRSKSLLLLVREGFRYADFMILPILFWVLRNLYSAPSDFFVIQNYNEISLRRLLYVPVQLATTLNEIFFGPIALFYTNSYPYIFTLIAILFGTLLFKLQKLNRYIVFSTYTSHRQLIIVSSFLIFIGSFPYLLVGKIPIFSGYETRHQLLLTIGFSIFVIASIDSLVTTKYKSFVLTSVLTIFITVSIQSQFRYLVGWLKQESIIEHLRRNPLPSHFNTVEVMDLVPEYNATDRPLTFYEWNGINKYTSGRENVLFVNDEFLSKLSQNQNLQNYIDMRIRSKAMLQRNMKDYYPDGSCHQVIISPTDMKLDSPFRVIRLLLKYYFRGDEFKTEITQYIKLNYMEDCGSVLKNSII